MIIENDGLKIRDFYEKRDIGMGFDAFWWKYYHCRHLIGHVTIFVFPPIYGIEKEEGKMFQVDGTAPHFSHEVWYALKFRFEEAHQRSVPPPRSPDPSQLDFLWVFIKNLIYAEKIRD
jgi:hypothetical protein